MTSTHDLRFVRISANCYGLLRVAANCYGLCRIRWVKVTDPREALFNILSRVCCHKGEKRDTTTCPAERATWKILKSRGCSCETNCNVRPFRRMYRLSGTYNIRDRIYSANRSYYIQLFNSSNPIIALIHISVYYMYTCVHNISLSRSSFHTITCFLMKLEQIFFE